MLLGGLEAGGTKMVCAIGNEQGEVMETRSFPTLDPETTMKEMIGFFKDFPIEALGIGSFGPLDLKPQSKTYGYITSTPKLKWQHFPLLTTFKEAFPLPMKIDTDVNAAALAEVTLGAAKGLSSCLYITVGTGVGGGLVVENNLVHGLVHPEFGHMLLTPSPKDPLPQGVCPFHKGCLEGLAAGPSIVARWGEAKNLPSDHEAWDLEATYLAQMAMNALVTFSPEKIILGGGVMQQFHLFPKIREKTLALLNGYIQAPAIDEGLINTIVPPGLGTKSGITGAFLLAKQALEEEAFK